jgi:membrane dipeptidase
MLAVRSTLASSTIYKNTIQRHKTFEASFDLCNQAHWILVINLVGVDYVGIGSDFDGIELPPTDSDEASNVSTNYKSCC